MSRFFTRLALAAATLALTAACADVNGVVVTEKRSDTLGDIEVVSYTDADGKVSSELYNAKSEQVSEVFYQDGLLTYLTADEEETFIIKVPDTKDGFGHSYLDEAPPLNPEAPADPLPSDRAPTSSIEANDELSAPSLDDADRELFGTHPVGTRWPADARDVPEGKPEQAGANVTVDDTLFSTAYVNTELVGLVHVGLAERAMAEVPVVRCFELPAPYHGALCPAD